MLPFLQDPFDSQNLKPVEAARWAISLSLLLRRKQAQKVNVLPMCQDSDPGPPTPAPAPLVLASFFSVAKLRVEGCILGV